jgi:shikimate dehydrogenase
VSQLAPHRLAVLGSPIAHSKSPALHSAAYAALGLDWQYEAIDVTEASLAEFVTSRGPEWRGLSLTMPLKRAVLDLLDEADDIARLTGGANTVLFDVLNGKRRLRGFNTDVFGITQAFQRADVSRMSTALILGGGATAASALVALSQLGCQHATIAVRTPTKARDLIEVGAAANVAVTIVTLGGVEGAVGHPDAVISTLPGGVASDLEFSHELRGSSTLFDVAYDPWPSALARQWTEAGGRVIPGIDMLVLQALVQVRIFVSGNPELLLDDEDRVLAAMRAAVASQ